MKPRLQCLDEMRGVYFTCVSAQLVFVTGIKQQPLPQLVTGHVKMTVSRSPHGTLVTEEYLTYCHHMGVSGNRFATHERGVNVRGIN
jgi:hypothetical protein